MSHVNYNHCVIGKKKTKQSHFPFQGLFDTQNILCEFASVRTQFHTQVISTSSKTCTI
jgi:hypothetical protein